MVRISKWNLNRNWSSHWFINYLDPRLLRYNTHSTRLFASSATARKCGKESGYSTSSQGGDGSPSFTLVPDNSSLQLQKIKNLVTSGLQVSKFKLRPDFGTIGKDITVGTNSVVYNVDGFKVYTYQVSFPSKIKSQSLRNALLDNLVNQLVEQPQESTHKIAHDYNNSLLSFSPLTLSKKYELYEVNTGKGTPTTVTISEPNILDAQKLVDYCNLDNLKANANHSTILNALNILLTCDIQDKFKPGNRPNLVKQSATKLMLMDVYKKGKNDINRGLYVCSGFSTSVRAAFGRMFINIQRTFAAFYRTHNPDGSLMSFINYAETLLDSKQKSNPSKFSELLQKSRDAFVGIRVTRKHLPHSRPSTIAGIAKKNAKTLEFETSDKIKTSVAAYFKKKYQIDLKYPEFPLIHLGGTNYVPAELLYMVPAQEYKGKRIDSSRMLEIANASGRESANILANEILPTVCNNNEDISKEMVLVPARIQSAPDIRYKSKTLTTNSADPSKKSLWSLKGHKFMVSGKAEPNCTFIVITDKSCKLDSSMKSSIAACFEKFRDCGIGFTKSTIVEAPLSGMDSKSLKKLENRVYEACKAAKNCNYSLVILPRKCTPIYEAVKRATDLRAGMKSNCVTSHKMLKNRGGAFDLECFGNVAMKVNLKLGGSNHVLGAKAALDDGTMLMGADITHATSSNPKMGTSVASVVASYDQWHSNFPGSLRGQTHNQDIIAEIGEMTTERLDHYYKMNKKLPKHILFYRDGVSESQFGQVVETELKAIRKAITAYAKGQPIPKLTLVVTIKRTNTRFFPDDNSTELDNVLPGATIDRCITSPYLFDFFIQSQQLPQKGITPTPTHYFVLYDDFGYNSNEIQKITYDLCHTFARATRAVKVCPPAYYADLLCTRGRYYLERKSLPKVNPNVENTMYYI